MARKNSSEKPNSRPDTETQKRSSPFHLEFLNQAQKLAWGAFDQHDVLFLLGAPGTGKSHLATAFAISEVLSKKKKKIVLTRPIVEAGERLGYLPGTFEEKVNPYMMPLYDCMDSMLGKEGQQRDVINRAVEVAPIAFMRGRSQPLDAKVLTPYGFKQMGDLQVGDKVVGSDGQPTEILGVYPQGQLDVYRMHFSDGTSVECSDDHLWSTMTLNEKRHDKGYSVKTTKEIRETIKNKFNQKIHRIPLANPVDFSRKNELPVNPYVLGAILGDGNVHEKASVTITNVNQDVVEKVAGLLPFGMRMVLANSYKSPQYRLVGDRNKRNPLKTYLRESGLLGLLSYQKFIPEEYLYSSISSRMELLRGLMDTDGSVFEHRSGNSRVQYYSTSHRLAKDVRFLVHSLGGTASIRKREFDENDCHEYNGRMINHCRAAYVVDIVIENNPFSMKDKADRFKPMNPRRIISNVEYIGKKDCQCIRVSAADSLYLTDHCIVTHNTFNDSVCIFDEAQNATKMQLKLFMTRFGVNSKIIITGDPNQSDIHNSGLMDVVRRLEDLQGIGVIHFKANSIVRHPLIAGILERLEDKPAE